MKRLFITEGIIQLFIGIGAIAAGIGFIIDPSGKNVGIPTEIIKNSPFDDFLIPGLFLLIINGIGSITGSILSFVRHRHAGTVGILLGIALIIWITAQVYWIGLSSWMQPFYFGLGMIEFLLGYIIRNRRLIKARI